MQLGTKRNGLHAIVESPDLNMWIRSMGSIDIGVIDVGQHEIARVDGFLCIRMFLIGEGNVRKQWWRR